MEPAQSWALCPWRSVAYYDGGGGGGGGGVRQMVITEGDEYKYLGVMVSNLGVLRTLGVTMGGETIIRVQAAV